MPSLSVKVTPPFEKVGKAIQSIKLGIAMQKGIEKLAFQVEKDAKKVTPVDTGRLRASIGVDIGNLYARIAPDTHYAIYVHEGTRYMRARPFMQIGAERATSKMGDDPVVKHIKSEIVTKLRIV